MPRPGWVYHGCVYQSRGGYTKGVGVPGVTRRGWVLQDSIPDIPLEGSSQY